MTLWSICNKFFFISGKGKSPRPKSIGPGAKVGMKISLGQCFSLSADSDAWCAKSSRRYRNVAIKNLVMKKSTLKKSFGKNLLKGWIFRSSVIYVVFVRNDLKIHHYA